MEASHWIFNLNYYFAELIKGSGVVIFMLLYALKIVAKETKWSFDDKIIGMLIGIFKGRK